MPHEKSSRNWDDSVILITGGGHGIGRSTALQMSERGATVFICGRTQSALDETVSLGKGPGRIVAFPADITQEGEVDALIEMVGKQAGRLDVLINNAGVLGPRTQVENVSLAEWKQTLDVNITGTFLVSRAAIELLRAGNNALIVNLSSSVGRQGRASWGPYAVSKHGVEGLTDVMAEELSADSISVVSLNPGGTATRMRAAAYPEEDPDTLPSADQVASTIVMLADQITPEHSGGRFDSRTMLGK